MEKWRMQSPSLKRAKGLGKEYKRLISQTKITHFLPLKTRF
jgi:hypothetical protein